MTPADLQSPPSPEAPPPSAGPAPAQKPDVSQAHYRDSDTECFACTHFDGNTTCALGVNGGQVEPGAGCDLFQKSDNDGDEGQSPDQGAPPQERQQ